MTHTQSLAAIYVILLFIDLLVIFAHVSYRLLAVAHLVRIDLIKSFFFFNLKPKLSTKLVKMNTVEFVNMPCLLMPITIQLTMRPFLMVLRLPRFLFSRVSVARLSIHSMETCNGFKKYFKASIDFLRKTRSVEYVQ